jgi:hypothetical protein
MNKGPFAVVQFRNNQTSVVPVKWIFKDDNTNELSCYWCESRRRVIDLESPNPNWPVWPVVKVIGRRGNRLCADCILTNSGYSLVND